MPEVRVLCSAGITQPQRSYDPVRLPHGPPPDNGVEAATLAHNGPPPITRNTFPTCRAHYPGGPSGCICRFLPRPCCLPQMAGGSASALSLSRPAQASRMLRPIGSLSRPRRPLSRGFSPAGYPHQAARQLPDLSTIIRVEPSSTDVPRLRGALPLRDIRYSSVIPTVARCRPPRRVTPADRPCAILPADVAVEPARRGRAPSRSSRKNHSFGAIIYPYQRGRVLRPAVRN